MSVTETEAGKSQVEADNTSPPTSSPRKRRRRAPATGAADDCFACQERQTKCDRRRPYCTPCLDMGKDCSGYKTALTWGVGVASRGKLRGLSLPITSSKKAAQSGDDEEEKRESPPRKMTKLSPSRKGSGSDATGSDQKLGGPATSAAGTSSRAQMTNYGFVNMDPASASQSSNPSPMFPSPNFEWRQPTSLSRSRNMRVPDRKARRHTLQPLHVSSMHPARDYGTMPMTASVVGGYGHHDFGLSSQISPMIPHFSGHGLISPSPKDFGQAHNAPYENNFFTSHHVGWDGHHIGSSVSSDHSSSQKPGNDDMHVYFGGSMDDMVPMQEPFQSKDLAIAGAPHDAGLILDPKFQAFTSEPTPLVSDDVGDHSSLLVPRSLPSLHIGNTPKLQFLIDYYDKVISPVIVAFDGPSNPYRSHILRLAMDSETLQHAIAALSASNLRMRRSQNPSASNRSLQSNGDSSHDQSVRRSSMAHSLMDVGVEGLPQTSNSEPSAEELHHKGAAIKGLNQQLADPNRREDDSILASLLILCLYHICDTGVAKFKTQFAGVKKILALRGGTKGRNSKATNWLTIMFTWFDAMTATVNDRESQLNGDDLDMSQLTGDEWALENLAGCDGRLFKTIAKLGRLNLLSQNKPVGRASPGRTSPTRSSPPLAPEAKAQPLPSPSGTDYYSMNNNRFDGNGWSEMRPPPTSSSPPPPQPDTRTQFWQEWTEIRQRLHEWHISPSGPPDTSNSGSGSNHPEDHVDLVHISESFRYSALLYTERLAYPHLPSAHPKFQSLVTKALYHIAIVKSDVFLLWPLFITGTECVSEQGRGLIRERCWGIQKDSGFFNNISGLELLEKVWRDDCGEGVGMGGSPVDEYAAVGGVSMPPPRSLTPTGNISISAPSSSTTATITGLGPAEYAAQGFKWRRAMERVDGEYIVV